MTKGMGYPLPPGDASESELECCIVFYPKRDAYRRALMGSLDYLATWIAWERDSEKRGQDAAASWKLANIQTWECTNMGYCDDLATTLDALLAATLALECCGEQDITDGAQFTDDVIDGVDDVPQNIIDAGYATDASDWDGFMDYKCMISHLAVDHVETFFRDISPFINDSGIVIGGIGVVGALLGAILVIIGLPISAGILVALGASAGIWTWIATYGKTAVLDLADEIATNHDELVCAIYQGDGVDDSISDFDDKVDELFSTIDAVAIKAINFAPQLRAMYSGRYNQEDIAQKLADLGYSLSSYDCDTCGQELGDFVEYVTQFPKNYDDTKAPPACEYATPITRVSFIKEPYSTWEANWRVKGTVFINGTMIENANCASSQDLIVDVRLCVDDELPGWPTCGAVKHRIYTNTSFPSGAVDLTLPFDEITDFEVPSTGDPYAKLVVQVEVDLRYGDIDIDIDIMVELIEFVPE